MKLKVNGNETELRAVESLADLLRALELDPERPGIAVALNDRVIPRRDLGATRVNDGDRVEVIHAVQGG
ncbi:MAG: sulfur carrier protein ThiS [Candidatus Eisenbacteria bacterium]|nr:sulfur carrier protein ThiS [Candidatus Eisenbacteria bacterium]MCC7143443.1 sulfur carrier protein ThiS [Candidatus Eisenbacteria bacterium]